LGSMSVDHACSAGMRWRAGSVASGHQDCGSQPGTLRKMTAIRSSGTEPVMRTAAYVSWPSSARTRAARGGSSDSRPRARVRHAVLRLSMRVRSRSGRRGSGRRPPVDDVTDRPGRGVVPPHRYGLAPWKYGFCCTRHEPWPPGSPRPCRSRPGNRLRVCPQPPPRHLVFDPHCAAPALELDLEQHLVVDRVDTLMEAAVVRELVAGLRQQWVLHLLEWLVDRRNADLEVLAQHAQGWSRW